MKKFILIAIAVLVVAGGLFYVLNSKGSTEPKLTKVTVAQTGDFLLYSALYIAEDAGFFEENGLDVTIVSTGGDEKSVAAVIARQAEFGVGDPTFAAIAKERGQDVSVVSSIVNGVPFWGITYSDETVSKFNQSGLSGLRVATFPSPSTAYTLQKDMYEDAELTPAVVEGAFGSLLGILEAGKAEIALELEPNVSTAVVNGAKVLYSMTDLYGDFAITGVTVDASYAKSNPETVQAFVTALQSAMDMARTDKSKTLDILDDRFPELASGVVIASLDRMVADGIIPLNTMVTEESWAKAVDLRIEVGDIKNRELALRALDNSFQSTK